MDENTVGAETGQDAENTAEVPATPEMAELEADIARTRAELADTVDQLTAKLDVKTRVLTAPPWPRTPRPCRCSRRASSSSTTTGSRPRPRVLGVGGGVLAAVAAVVLVKLWRRQRPATPRRSVASRRRSPRVGHSMVGRRGSDDGERRAEGRAHHRDEAGHDAADKPDSPADLTKQSWFYVARKTVREFSDDQCTDLAAALTYYSVLALFPAAIAILSLVGLVGQGPKTVDTLLQILRDVGASSAADTLEPTLTQLSNTPERRRRPHPRSRRRAVVRLRVRRRVRPRHEPDLRDRRGPADLEAATQRCCWSPSSPSC